MRRTKKHATVAVQYEFVEDEALRRLHEQGISVEFDQEHSCWSIRWPLGLKWEQQGERLGVQLYDNSTCVTVRGAAGMRLYVTREADPLHRPDFDALLQARQQRREQQAQREQKEST